MKYLLIIASDESLDEKMSDDEQSRIMSRYFSFTNECREAGVLVACEALHSTGTATTVRVRDGNALTTDGPYAEAKEHIGGFYLLDCSNLDEAIQYAARIPHAAIGSVEIRPVIDFSEAACA